MNRKHKTELLKIDDAWIQNYDKQRVEQHQHRNQQHSIYIARRARAQCLNSAFFFSLSYDHHFLRFAPVYIYRTKTYSAECRPLSTHRERCFIYTQNVCIFAKNTHRRIFQLHCAVVRHISREYRVVSMLLMSSRCVHQHHATTQHINVCCREREKRNMYINDNAACEWKKT